MNARLSSLASRFSLASNAAIFAAFAALLATSAGIRANDFPPLPPGLVSASPPSGLTPGQGVSPSVTEYGALRVVIDTPGGADVDVTQAQPTYPYPSTGWTVAQASCTSAGTVAALADSAGAAKQRSFVNVSGSSIYIGPASGVTASNGFAIPSGAAPSNPMPGYTGPVYCYAASTVSLGVSQLQ